MSYQSPKTHKYQYPNVRYLLGDESFRASLEPRVEPYWMMLANGRALGLSKWKGAYWHARLKLRDGRYKRTSLGTLDAKGRSGTRPVLSFEEALEAAEAWFSSFGDRATTHLTYAERRIELPQPRSGKTYTVGHALRDHLTWLGHSGKPVQGISRIMRNVLMPEFGDIPLARLQTECIQKWMEREAARIDQDRLAGVPLGERQPLLKELRRKRQRTVNHDLSVLRMALDHAFINRKIDSDSDWRRVRGYKNVQQPVPLKLSADALEEFFVQAPQDIALLCKAALTTGARQSELIGALVSDLQPASGKVVFVDTKKGDPRVHLLSEEALSVLCEAAQKRDPAAALFLRRDGRPWTKASAKYELRQAQENQVSPRIGFRALRHWYGSGLAAAGIPSRIIADQMGHLSSTTAEIHYAHLSDDYRDSILRKLVPKLLPA